MVGVTAAIGGVVAWIVVRLTSWLLDASPDLPWTLAALLWVLAVLVWITAWITHRKVHVERRWVAASRGIRLLVLGKAATVTGSFGTGFLLVFAALFVERIAIEVSAWRVVVGVISAGACAVMSAAGIALQRACHLPDGD